MTRRPAVTLVEVLITMFIMAIGLLALMVLFPLGALNMAQALKDDRCASTASMASNVAIACDIRHDLNVLASFTIMTTALQTANGGVNAGYTGPSTPIYVDPYGVLSGYTTVGASAIPRITINPATVSAAALTPPVIDRWFSLPDDVTFSANGAADVSNGFVERGRRYSYAYLLQRPEARSDKLVNLTVVVYSGRPIGALALEQTYSAQSYVVAGQPSPNGLTITWNPAVQAEPAIKRGGWILDTSSSNSITVNGFFYRVTNIVDSSPGTMIVEVSPNLKVLPPPTGTITVMDHVAEVFDKGAGWRP